MPEAPVDKDAGLVFPHHDIRFPWQSLVVQPVSEAMTPQEFAHNNLRLRVFGTNRGHIFVALFGCQVVRHGMSEI